MANLRRAFSGIVAGNVKEDGIAAIEREGPFELQGDPAIMAQLDELLRSFVTAGRMKLPGSVYKPCYRIALTPRSGNHSPRAAISCPLRDAVLSI